MDAVVTLPEHLPCILPLPGGANGAIDAVRSSPHPTCYVLHGIRATLAAGRRTVADPLAAREAQAKRIASPVGCGEERTASFAKITANGQAGQPNHDGILPCRPYARQQAAFLTVDLAERKGSRLLVERIAARRAAFEANSAWTRW